MIEYVKRVLNCKSMVCTKAPGEVRRLSKASNRDGVRSGITWPANFKSHGHKHETSTMPKGKNGGAHAHGECTVMNSAECKVPNINKRTVINIIEKAEVKTSQ